MRIVKNNQLFESDDFFDDDEVNVTVDDTEEIAQLSTIGKAERNQYKHSISFYFVVYNTDILNNIQKNTLIPIREKIKSLVDDCQYIEPNAFSLAVKYVASHIGMFPNDSVPNHYKSGIIEMNMESDEITTVFNPIYNGEYSSSSFLKYNQCIFEIILSFDFTKEAEKKMTKYILKELLRLSQNIINATGTLIKKQSYYVEKSVYTGSKTFRKQINCGVIFDDWNKQINANPDTLKFKNTQKLNFISHLNKIYNLGLSDRIRRNAEIRTKIPADFFRSIDDNLAEKYRTELLTTDMSISEEDNIKKIIFDGDVTLYKLIIALECAQDYYDVDSTDELKVIVNGTLFIRHRLLEDYEWMEYIESVNRLVLDDVDINVVEKELLQKLFIKELVINNPHGSTRNASLLFYDKHDEWKNPDVEITSQTHTTFYEPGQKYSPARYEFLTDEEIAARKKREENQ